MTAVRVALSLGSNLGNRLLNLRAAVSALKSYNLEVTRRSDVFETAPWGVTDQPCFLNACLLAGTSLEPEALLALLKDIEAKMGRTPARRWGERLIDIDILIMESRVYNSPALHIPHADMHRRLFVLAPLAQIFPDWIHPGTARTVSEMAAVLYETEREKPVRICAL